MTPSILFALGAMLSGGWSDLLYKRAQNRGIDATCFLFIQSTIYTAIIWAIGLVLGSLQGMPPRMWLFAALSGPTAYFGLLMFLRSLRSGQASVNVPIFRLSFVITAIIAILLLGESIGTPKLIGLVLASLAVLSLANLAASKWNIKALAPLLAAMAIYGVVGILIKEATNAGGNAVAVSMIQSGAFVTCAIINALVSGKLKPNETTVRYAPVIAVTQLLWSLLLIQSLRLGDASISYPIVQMSFVLTTLLAVFMLGEQMTKYKLLGLGLAVLAVSAFALH